MTTRPVSNIVIPTIAGVSGSAESLLVDSMRVEGVSLFNCLPESLKCWNGTQEAFKYNLDKFLERIPDNPDTETLIPDCVDYWGHSSNSIKDWV